MRVEDKGLTAVESPLGEQILQVIDAYIESHPEMADVEMTEQINRAMREVQSMVDFVCSIEGVMADD
jgi:hypothetical protein